MNLASNMPEDSQFLNDYRRVPAMSIQRCSLEDAGASVVVVAAAMQQVWFQNDIPQRSSRRGPPHNRELPRAR
jgi:hypothetical protein